MPGSATAIGTDTVIAACSVPASGNRTTTVCSSGSATAAGSDTVIAACSAPASGNYTTAICASGSATALGTNTASAACAVATAGQYTQTACVPGSATALGTNTAVGSCTAATNYTSSAGQSSCSACSTCGSSTFTQFTCVANANTVCGACSPGCDACTNATTCTACAAGYSLISGACQAPGTTCGTVGEGGTLTLSCPAGQTMTAVDFASYGTPTGACGAYATSSCSSSISVSVLATACLTKNSCTVSALNGVFGDPCGGTVKKLTAQVRCTTPVDCRDILTAGLSTGDGVYTIDPDGSGPGTPFPTYCDMTTGGWTLLNDQDVDFPAPQTGYLSTATWAAGVNTTPPNGGQWGVLNRMSSFQRSDGAFELRLTYGTTATQYVSWTQTANPFSGTRGPIVVTGMNPANQSGCSAFAGLTNDTTAVAALDGDSGPGCWWFAVGASQGYPTDATLPASNSPLILPTRIKLWARKASTSGLQHCWAGEGNGADSATSNTARAGSDVTFAAGKNGQAFTCSLVSGTATTNVRASTAPTVSSIGPWTYEFWVNRLSSSASATVLDRTTSGVPLINLNTDAAGSSSFTVRYDSGTSMTSLAFSLPGGYHHLAAVRGGGNFTFYRDGVVVGAVSDSGSSLRPDPPRWCGSGQTSNSAMTGQFDSLRIWSRALSATEIASVALGTGACSTLPLP